MANADGDRTPARGIPPRLVGLGLVVVVLGVFVATNFEQVQVQFLWAEVETQLAVALLVAAVLGFVLGWLVERNRNR